jgi:hypothetical protein
VFKGFVAMAERQLDQPVWAAKLITSIVAGYACATT